MKVNVGAFLWKFIKLGSAWSGQLPDLGSKSYSEREPISGTAVMPGTKEFFELSTLN
jgi:hypothetical protein